MCKLKCNNIMVSFKVVLILVLNRILSIQGVRQLYKSDGDLNIAFLVNNCPNSTDNTPYNKQTLITSAIWSTERINFLKILAPLSLGLTVYETCTPIDTYKTIFHLYEQHEEEYFLGLLSDNNLNDKIMKFSDLLEIRTRISLKNNIYLYKTTSQFLSAVGWVENVTVFAPEENILTEFYRYTKSQYICLKDCHIYRSNCLPVNLTNTGPIVFFGKKNDVEQLGKQLQTEELVEDLNILFVPIDGSVPKGLPDKSFVIIPPHEPLSTKIPLESFNIQPNPLLLDIANPILDYADNIVAFMKDHCNETVYKINCIRNKFNKNYNPQSSTANKIMETLHIEPLKQFFVYNIFRVENDTMNTSELAKKNNFFQPYNKVFIYNVFDNNLTLVDQNFDVNSSMESLAPSQKCFSSFDKTNIRRHGLFITDALETLNIRTDSWVYAFLSLSLLGIIFCFAILVFLLISICRRDILEGNPLLTISLLLAVMLMFCAVLPFALEVNKFTRESLCLAKSLAITSSYAIAFSLVLSRCILLATSSKDIGFMSHIAGPVQSFLCLFIFGVQAALNLQILGRCHDIFRGFSFIYLMSYNAMLLLLLLCLCPLIYGCQRNYREGKYFSIAIGLITCVWCIWIPCYAILSEEFREPILCFGLITSAGIFLGAIFIPRTYLMTIAAARDKITSALPSLATATSAMDLYRANNAQPVYDCVNVAAINAVTVARAGVAVPSLQQPDLYSCPALPEDDDFDFRCDTPVSNDKVTRF